jgi:hypothetical protein
VTHGITDFARHARNSVGLLVSSTTYAQEAGNEWTSGSDRISEQAPPAVQSAAPSAKSSPEPSQRAPLRWGGDDPTADQAGTDAGAAANKNVEKRILHGFRMGYLSSRTTTSRRPATIRTVRNCSLKERYGMRTPHQYLLGYEVMGRLIGHGWLNVVVVGNVLVSGLEQSKFWPSANLLIGFEFDESFQVGVGPNFTLEEDKPAHLVMAGGWTPKVGSFFVPVHGFFIPDVDGNHRMGATVGVNW